MSRVNFFETKKGATSCTLKNKKNSQAKPDLEFGHCENK